MSSREELQREVIKKLIALTPNLSHEERVQFLKAALFYVTGKVIDEEVSV